MRRASRQAWCEALAHTFTLAQGVGRSTEAIAQPVARRPCGRYAARIAHKDTPKKIP
ncbi:MAG: hypothetical protein NZ455_06710 [Bacteroidia bacterium]|nr:hypothetical protein [Bacteroidia bacterium]MDW8346038.1 hypothetical protein [Bacteroidia bacterium]